MGAPGRCLMDKVQTNARSGFSPFVVVASAAASGPEKPLLAGYELEGLCLKSDTMLRVLV